MNFYLRVERFRVRKDFSDMAESDESNNIIPLL